jgi:hypothetical protein
MELKSISFSGRIPPSTPAKYIKDCLQKQTIQPKTNYQLSLYHSNNSSQLRLTRIQPTDEQNQDENQSLEKNCKQFFFDCFSQFFRFSPSSASVSLQTCNFMIFMLLPHASALEMCREL